MGETSPAAQLHRTAARTKAAARRDVLGDDIRRYLIFDEGDAIAQLQLALFQTLQPQQIRRGRLMQGIDRRVEISVFLLQPCELDFEFALIFVGHDVRQLKNAMRLLKGRRKRPELISSLPAFPASSAVPCAATLHMK